MLVPPESDSCSSAKRNTDNSDNENRDDIVVNDVDDQNIHNIKYDISGTQDVQDRFDRVDGLATNVGVSGNHDYKNYDYGLNAVPPRDLANAENSNLSIISNDFINEEYDQLIHEFHAYLQTFEDLKRSKDNTKFVHE